MNYLRNYIDLRSDTVTLPSTDMREHICRANVGDDVMKEDPTVNELEAYSADLFGKEAALFLPSGTMANQVAVRAYAGPGDEILMIDEAHLFWYEGGGAAGISGVQLHPVVPEGHVLQISDFEKRIRATDPHFPKTKLFWIENTHNRWGGQIIPFEFMVDLSLLSKKKDIPIHVDGARIVNASVATGISLRKWGEVCDSLSLCFSKGLGAPVGSILVGNKVFIEKCLFARKTLGGGMRQVGFIAAAALFALKNNIHRLSEDHENAQLLGKGLNKLNFIHIDEVDTNIVLIHLDKNAPFSAQQLVEYLLKHGVKVLTLNSHCLRAVTHLGVTKPDILRVIEIFSSILKRFRGK